MSEEVYTVEQFAERLKLHPKTVLRFIKDGRLRAVRVGKSYRIARSDMEAMMGVPSGGARAIRVTSIVDLADVSPEAAQRLTRQVTSLRMGRETPPAPMNIDVAFDPATRGLKVVIVGSPSDTSAVLKMVEVLAQD